MRVSARSEAYCLDGFAVHPFSWLQSGIPFLDHQSHRLAHFLSDYVPFLSPTGSGQPRLYLRYRIASKRNLPILKRFRNRDERCCGSYPHITRWARAGCELGL